jgi:hypothetical protein
VNKEGAMPVPGNNACWFELHVDAPEDDPFKLHGKFVANQQPTVFGVFKVREG